MHVIAPVHMLQTFKNTLDYSRTILIAQIFLSFLDVSNKVKQRSIFRKLHAHEYIIVILLDKFELNDILVLS